MKIRDKVFYEFDLELELRVAFLELILELEVKLDLELHLELDLGPGGIHQKNKCPNKYDIYSYHNINHTESFIEQFLAYLTASI